jgi:hypothetical protein
VSLSEFGRVFWADELAALEPAIKAAATIRLPLVKLHPDDPKDPRWVLDTAGTPEAAPVAKRRTRGEYRCGCATIRMFADDFERCDPRCSACGSPFAA